MILEERECSGGQANLPPPDLITINKVIVLILTGKKDEVFLLMLSQEK